MNIDKKISRLKKIAASITLYLKMHKANFIEVLARKSLATNKLSSDDFHYNIDFSELLKSFYERTEWEQ